MCGGGGAEFYGKFKIRMMMKKVDVDEGDDNEYDNFCDNVNWWCTQFIWSAFLHSPVLKNILKSITYKMENVNIYIWEF